MTKISSQSASETDNGPALAIPVDKVCWIIIKAREFDVKNEQSEPDPASNTSENVHRVAVRGRADRSRCVGLARS